MKTKKIKSKKRLLKSRKRLFLFTSSFYFLTILARLFLLFLMVFIISKIFLSIHFPPKREVYAALYCCETFETIYTLPYAFHGFQNAACTLELLTQYTLPFTVGAGLGSTTYYQLPANVSYYLSQASICQ